MLKIGNYIGFDPDKGNMLNTYSLFCLLLEL